MPEHPKRTEDDLRAAFALAAQQAPSTEDVLARLAAAQREIPPARIARRRRALRVWLPIAAVAAVVLAVGIPVGIELGNNRGQQYSAGSSIEAADGKGADNSSAAGSSRAAGSNGIAGGPINGGSEPGLGPEVAPSNEPSTGRTCPPADVALSLAWTESGGRLTGTLSATNRMSLPCDLAVQPAVYPLDQHGVRLAVDNIASAEGYAGPRRLLPGHTATSTINWPGWCGVPAGHQVEVGWGTGAGDPATVTATGPTTPSCVAGPTSSISSSWFSPLS
jgi:hypothetical protein